MINNETILADGLIPFSFPGLARVRCLFSTALAGDMSLDAGGNGPGGEIENRIRLMDRAGFGQWAELRQIHGDVLVAARGEPRPDRASLIPADGHYTKEKNVGLVIKTADCQPILIARKDGGAVAALHVGWRGNAMNFPGTAIARLCREFSCGGRDLLAVRGPSLGPAASEFVNFASEWPPEFAPWYDPGHKTVNLWALTRHQLQEAGVPPEQIFGLDLCTRTMANLLFSYRRKDSGRHVNAIWIADSG